MSTSLLRHSPTFESKTLFSNPSYSDSDDNGDDAPAVRLHSHQAPAVGRPAPRPPAQYTPLGEYTVALPMPGASRSRSMSVSSPLREQPAAPPTQRRASVDTKHVIGAATPDGLDKAATRAKVKVDPRFTDLVLFAREDGRRAADVVAQFGENVLLPVLRDVTEFPRQALLEVLHGLAKSQSALDRVHPGLSGLLVAEVVKALGDANMHGAARGVLEEFALTLVERARGSQASPLLAPLVSALRAPLDGEGVARLPAEVLAARREAFMALMCRLGGRWDEADAPGLTAFVSAQVRALLDATRGTHISHEITQALVAGSAHLPAGQWAPVAAGLLQAFCWGATGQAHAYDHLKTVVRSLLERVAAADRPPAVLAAISAGLAMQVSRDVVGPVTRALHAVLAAPGLKVSEAQREAMHRAAQLERAAANTPAQRPPAPSRQVPPVAGHVEAGDLVRPVTHRVSRLMTMAEGGATSKALCKAFDNDVLRPLLRAKPPAGQGAFVPEVLTHVLDQLAHASEVLDGHQPRAELFEASLYTLFQRLGGHRMREADIQDVFDFVASLAQGQHAERRVDLIGRILGQLRDALGGHHMAPSRQDQFIQVLCEIRQQWPVEDVNGFESFCKVQLSGLLGPVKERAPRAASVVDSLARAARRLEHAADLVILAKGLAGAVTQGVSDAPGRRKAVCQASSLWLPSLLKRDDMVGLTAVCHGVAMQSRDANTRAALFGLLDAMAGLADDARADQMDAMAQGIADCRPSADMLRQWLDEGGDPADAQGPSERRLAAQRVVDAIAHKAGLDIKVNEEQPAAMVARGADSAAVLALVRGLMARTRAGDDPQVLAGQFAIDIARYKTPDAAGGVRLQGAAFAAIASRLFDAAGVLLERDPATQPLGSPLAALLRALVDAGGGAALSRPELDVLFQQLARLKGKGVAQATAIEACVHEALFGALRRGAPERPTQAQAVEWSAQVRRFFLAARRPAAQDGQLECAAQALARHSAGLSADALAFMSAGLVRGVTDLAPHAPQDTRGIVQRNVAYALRQLMIAVAGQPDGRSRLAFVGLGAATAFNDEQRKPSQRVLLDAIDGWDAGVREGLDGWMHALAGRVSRPVLTQWIETAQADARSGRVHFSLSAPLGPYLAEVAPALASPELFSAMDPDSGLGFTQAFAAVEALLNLPMPARNGQPVPTAHRDA